MSPAIPRFALILALLARLSGDETDDAKAALRVAGLDSDTLEALHHLWKATKDPAYLAEAKRLLDYRVEHAPEEYHGAMLTNVRVNREIMQAWEAEEADE